MDGEDCEEYESGYYRNSYQAGYKDNDLLMVNNKQQKGIDFKQTISPQKPQLGPNHVIFRWNFVFY